MFFVSQGILNNMFNFTLEINGKPVSIDRVLKGVKWSNVYVNGYTSCHTIPSHLIVNNGTHETITFRVSGNTYKVTK